MKHIQLSISDEDHELIISRAKALKNAMRKAGMKKRISDTMAMKILILENVGSDFAVPKKVKKKGFGVDFFEGV
jgi:hypothetical protein